MFKDNTEDVAKQKLTMLYILQISPERISKEKLTEILIDNFNINFFIIQQYVSELAENSFISFSDLDGETVVNLEKPGSEILDYFKGKISKEMTDSIHKIFGLDPSGKRMSSHSEGNSYPRDNGEINVNLKLVEMDETIFSLYISVPNQEHADLLMKKWKDSPDKYYKSIIDLFINEKPTI